MPLPIITVAEMRAWEQASWAAGRVETDVISRVGRIVADYVNRMTREGDVVLLLAGKGHNGDDVRQAQAHLGGREVCLLDVTDPAESLPTLGELLGFRPALVVDGLFGIGLNRPLEGAWEDLVKCLNDARLPVLAVDVPSGLNADTGEVQGAAVRARVTLTLGAPKRGLVMAKAAEWVGRLEVAPEIGLAECPLQSELSWTVGGDFRDFPPERLVSGHKGTHGHLAILAGSLGYHGAAVMAAQGALRARPGLVTLLTPAAVYVPVASQLRAVMVHPMKADHALLDDSSAVLAGPGLVGREVESELGQRVNQLWKNSEGAMVVDASALAWLQAVPVRHPELRVITPHPGEAAGMLRVTVADVQADRVKAVRELSRRFGQCWVVLKGHQTVIGRSSGEVFVNSSGNPGLGQGGTGDVLAGYLAGLLAQPELRTADPGRLIRFAVWQHGATADLLSGRRRVWTVDDLMGELGNCT